MKKIICIFLFATIAMSSSAQQTLTRDFMPNTGDTIFYRTIPLVTQDFSATGIDFVWNFSDLTGTTWSADTFVTVLSTPLTYNAVFNNPILYPLHKATIASPQADITIPPSTTISNVYYYFKENETEFAQVGLAANVSGAPLPVRFDDIDNIYKFPSTMNSIDSCYSSYNINIPTLGFYAHKQNRINEYDGWGILYTALDTFEVFRIKTIINARDSVFVTQYNMPFAFNTTTVEYKWFSPGYRAPIFIVTSSQGQGQNRTTVKYIDNPQLYLSVNETEKNSANIFPNPATNCISITVKGETPITEIKIFNQRGALLIHEKHIKSSSCKVDTSKLPSGSYIIETKTEKSIQRNTIIIK